MKTILATVALLTAFAAAPAAAQEVDIAFRDGRVSLAASEASAADVLAIWSRVGQTEMKGIELLEKRLVTLKVDDVPEAEALRLILGREFSFTGYTKRYVEPGTSSYYYLYLSALEPEPWVDPEIKYAKAYAVPDKTAVEYLEPKYPLIEGDWYDPEVKYTYDVPEKAVPDGLTPKYTWIDPIEWLDPELRFEYYMPQEGDGLKPVYPKTTNPNPWVDPELRFSYVVPNKG